ncbi:MAG: hypothetical protein HOA63_00730 [Nitrosopumilus sp.]|nr:hypothetical protein [Nitrosopumilus sp.]
MNFSYGVIAVVGILVAISLALIIAEPNDIIEPRIIETSENKITQIEKELNQLSVNPSLLTSASNVDGALVLEVEFRDDAGNIVDHVNYDIFATQDSDSILSDPASHRHPGKYPVHESTPLNDSLVEIQVIVQGLGHGDDIFGPKGIETVFTITPVVSPPIATSTEIKTSDNSGMSMDCQASLDCYTPSVVTVSVGDVVNMINSDSAAAMHSFTAGSVDGFTPSPSGTFDTGIMSADDTFEWTPETSGEVPYYCLLHTWMQGTIIVE